MSSEELVNEKSINDHLLLFLYVVTEYKNAKRGLPNTSKFNFNKRKHLDFICLITKCLDLI